MCSLVSFPNDAPIEEILAVFRRDGAVIINNMISEDSLCELNRELQGATASFQTGTRSPNESVIEFWGRKTIRYTRLAQRSKVFLNEVLVHPMFHGIVRPELNSDAYWMNTGQTMYVTPGERAQILHRDAENWPDMCLSQKQPEVTVSCMFALGDFTADNGATVVVPQSHLWEDYSRKPLPSEITQAVMPAGSGMIYSGKVIHGAGANVSDVWRHGMHLSFVQGWLTPEEAGCLSIDATQAKQLTPFQQRLLGFKCYDISATTPTGARLWTLDYEDIPLALGW
jgi:ectoine hydroxylase-related dioxygenase (phytanoyl-CoA dioxygenase family)